MPKIDVFQGPKAARRAGSPQAQVQGPIELDTSRLMRANAAGTQAMGNMAEIMGQAREAHLRGAQGLAAKHAAITQAGEKAINLGNALIKASGMIDLNNAEAAATKELADLGASYTGTVSKGEGGTGNDNSGSTRPADPAEWEDDYRGKAKAIMEKYSETLGIYTRSQFNSRIGSFETSQYLKVRRHAQATMVTNGRADTLKNIDELYRLIPTLETPEEAMDILAKIEGQVDDAVGAGFYSKKEAEVIKQTYRGKVGENIVLGDIKADPYGTKKRLLQDKKYIESMFLTPDSHRTLIDKADTEIRHLESEKRRKTYEQQMQAAEKSAELSQAMQDNLAHITEHGKSLNPDRDLYAELRDLGTPASVRAAERYRTAVLTAHDTYNTVAEAKSLPIPERMSYLQKMKPGEGSADFAVKQQAWEKAVRLTGAYTSKQLGDPAVYFQPAAIKLMQKDRVNLAAMSKPEALQTQIKYSLIVQRENGLPGVILSDVQKDSLKQQYATARTSQERVKMVTQLQEAYGKYTGQILRELQMPYDVTVAAMLARQPGMSMTALDVMTAANAQEKDFSMISNEDRKDGGQAWWDAYRAGELSAFANLRAHLVPGQDSTQFATAMGTLGKKLTWLNQRNGMGSGEASERALQALQGAGTFVAREDVAVVQLPRGTDADEFTYAATAFRAGLRPALEKALEHFRQAYPEEFSGVGDLFHKEFIDDLVEEGIFLNDDQGGFNLVHPLVGRRMVGADGRPMRFTLAEIMEAGAGQIEDPRKTAIMNNWRPR